MREEGDLAKTACGSLLMCSGLESDIEGATHAVAQRRWKRTVPALEGREED